MAWWDSQPSRDLGASPRSRSRLTMGDAFPRLEPSHFDKHADMERERALLSPVFEEQLGPPTTPALVVHVDIHFTDPVIRSRYCRSYGSSPEFEATNRICRGLVRRIERCSEEFITRKDSGALEMFKGDTYERKPQRFEMTFRVMRRGKGEWAERTYRSYQKQPLTVALTKEVALATHRMIGLFLRRHDRNFRWLDCPAPEADSEGSETTVPSRDGPLSLLSVPRSRFVEATQTFEFVPGYSMELCFRSRNPQRQVRTFERSIKVNSTQTTPLTLFMSEDMLWKALQSINQGLDSRKRQLDKDIRNYTVLDSAGIEDDTLEIGLRVSNNLGPLFSHVRRNITSKLALFRDSDARDCDNFLRDLERHLSHIRNEADSALNSINDLEFRIVELKGVGWTLREPAKFTLGSSASYGRRTIQAALDRIQTGIGDVIRGHNIAIHINAHKRGHLVLDKAIVAHEKRGKPKETFSSHEDAQAAFVARLKDRIQKDIDKVFEDSCSIDDIPEDEEDYFARPMTPVQPKTPVQPEQAVFDGPSPRYSPSSIRSSPAKPRPALSSLQSSPRPRTQRVFSLSRRSTESVRSVDYLKPARDLFPNDNSRPSTAVSEQQSEPHGLGSPVFEALGPPLATADVKPARSFSLVSRRPSSTIRVSNASTLVEEQTVSGSDADGQNHEEEIGDALQRPVESGRTETMTSSEEEAGPAAAQAGSPLADSVPDASLASHPAVQQPEASSSGDNRDAPSAVPEFKQRRMDTPEVFVDAREYVASPVPEGIGKLEYTGALTGTRSPINDGEFSTAPSTPELSTGASSPRQSALVTPVYLRTDSGTKDPVIQEFYPEPEPERAAVDLRDHVESSTEPESKENHDSLATDALPGGDRPSINLSPHAVTPLINPTIEAPETGNAVRQCASESPDPAARVVSRHETPDDAQPAAAAPPRPCSTTASTITPVPAESNKTAGSETNAAAPQGQVYTTILLGAELTAKSDRSPSAPDFPTPQVRRRLSDPNREGGQSQTPLMLTPSHNVTPQSKSASETPAAAEATSKSPPQSEGTASALEPPPPGSELGAGRGAESTPAEDKVRSEVPDDVAGVVGGAAPAETVPSWAEVAAEGVALGTVGTLEGETHGVLGEVQGPNGDGGSEEEDGECRVGGEGRDAGPGVVAEELGTETEGQLDAEGGSMRDVGSAEEAVNVSSTTAADIPAAETPTNESSEPSDGAEGTAVPDAGPAEEAVDVSSAADADVPAAETTAGECSEPSNGAGADSEEATAEPEGDSSDKVADTVNVAHSRSETSIEAEKDLSGPGATAEQTEHVAADPGEPANGPIPVPTSPGPEEAGNPQVESATGADKFKFLAVKPEDGDVVGAADEASMSESQAETLEIGDGILLNGEKAAEEGGAVPTEGDAAEPDDDDKVEDSGAVSAMTGSDYPENPEHDVPEVGEKQITTPSVADGLEAESSTHGAAGVNQEQAVKLAEFPESAEPDTTDTGASELDVGLEVPDRLDVAPAVADSVDTEDQQHDSSGAKDGPPTLPALSDDTEIEGEIPLVSAVSDPSATEVLGDEPDTALVMAGDAGSSALNAGEETKPGLNDTPPVADADGTEGLSSAIADRLEEGPETGRSVDDAYGTETGEKQPVEVDDQIQGVIELGKEQTDEADDESQDVPEEGGGAAVEPLTIQTLPDVIGSGFQELDGAKEEDQSAIPIATDDAPNGPTVGAEVDVVLGATGENIDDGPEVPAGEVPAPEGEALEPKTEEARRDGPDSQDKGLIQDAAVAGVMAPEAEDVEPKVPQEVNDKTNGIGEEGAFESNNNEERRVGAGVGDDESSNNALGPDIDIDEPGAAPDNRGRELESNHDVCAEPGTPEQQPDKHLAPTISVDDLTIPSPAISAPMTETAGADADATASAAFSAESAADDIPTLKPAPPPPSQPEEHKAQPHLAPIPDLSKLSRLSPTTTRTSLSSDAASFTSSSSSITRNSVDTIRPSTDLHRPPTVPFLKPEHASTSSRPQTAGYLNLGLRPESRFFEVGLRGALGDVKSRRLSLPLQSMPDNEALREVVAAGAEPRKGPASDAGSSRTAKSGRLRKRRRKGDERHGDGSAGGDEDGQSVLPRMMMLLAGAVAIGKIMKRAAE